LCLDSTAIADQCVSNSETDHLCPKQEEGQTLSLSVPKGFQQRIPVPKDSNQEDQRNQLINKRECCFHLLFALAVWPSSTATRHWHCRFEGLLLSLVVSLALNLWFQSFIDHSSVEPKAKARELKKMWW
jgi:hypothetical protein